MHAGAVDQRPSPMRVRLPRVRGRFRQHLVIERAAESTHTWSNDPVSDTPAEAVYIRDEVSGDLWSATPLPIREPSSGPCHPPWLRLQPIPAHRARHLAGSSAIRALAGSVKISRLTIVNRCAEPRRLSVTHYLEWVLGISAAEPRLHRDRNRTTTGAMLARNPWDTDFQSRIAFMDMPRQQACTADRAEFIGRHGSLAEPAALLEAHRLSNRVGGGLDPCGAMQTNFTLQPARQPSSGSCSARGVVRRRRCPRGTSPTLDLDAALKEVTTFGNRRWRGASKDARSLHGRSGQGWLLYQTLSCPRMARTPSINRAAPTVSGINCRMSWRSRVETGDCREHILRAAGRQFDEGMCSIGGSRHPPGGEDPRLG